VLLFLSGRGEEPRFQSGFNREKMSLAIRDKESAQQTRSAENERRPPIHRIIIRAGK
jgi:hypothetical protein